MGDATLCGAKSAQMPSSQLARLVNFLTAAIRSLSTVSTSARSFAMSVTRGGKNLPMGDDIAAAIDHPSARR